MNTNGHINKLRSQFLRFVHLTLFFDLLVAHVVPPALDWVLPLIQQGLPLIKGHAAFIALAMGLLVMVIEIKGSEEESEGPKRPGKR